MNESIIRGYLKKEEQADSMVRDTTCNSNIETLSYHFRTHRSMLYCRHRHIQNFCTDSGIPRIFHEWTDVCQRHVRRVYRKFLMKKFNVDFLQDDVLQSKITSWTSDYLVVCAFMAVAFNVIGDWIIPMLVECAIMTVVTFAVCFYFGQRFGSDNDFERTLGTLRNLHGNRSKLASPWSES